MMNILIDYDLFLIRHVCEPVLHRLQRWNGKDNFWWFKKILDSLHGVLFLYSGNGIDVIFHPLLVFLNFNSVTSVLIFDFH